MSTQKKSLVSAAGKTTKMAHVVSASLELAKGTKGVKMAKAVMIKAARATRAAKMSRARLAANHNQTMIS